MNTRRLFLVTAVLAVALLALAACGGGSAAPEPLNITLKGEDIKFDVTTITAKVNQPINVTYINTGALEHTFLIDGLVDGEKRVAPGQTLTFSFVPTAAGTYTYYCNVAGHQQAGMTGTLTVNP